MCVSLNISFNLKTLLSFSSEVLLAKCISFLFHDKDVISLSKKKNQLTNKPQENKNLKKTSSQEEKNIKYLDILIEVMVTSAAGRIQP